MNRTTYITNNSNIGGFCMENIKNIILNIIGTICGAFIISVGVALFLLPNQLSSGGLSGLATVIYYFLNLPMGIAIIALNIPLFLFSSYKLGKGFFINSIIGTISLSFFIDVLEKLEPLTNDRLLACIYGGILIGLGTAIVLKNNSSTGGTDLLSQIVKEYNHNIHAGTIIVIADIIIVAINVMFFKEIEIGLYSAIAIYLSGKMIDIIFEGIYFTKLLFIVSDKAEDIATEIGNKIKRGTTGLYGKGMYTNKDKLILMCATARRDVGKVKQIAKQIDPNCFMVITNSREVVGEGFKVEK